MNKTIRRNMTDLPFSLHDARVGRIELTQDTVRMYFDKGFYKVADGVLVSGYVAFESIDPDFCSVYLTETSGQYGRFIGEKISLADFARDYPCLQYEIVDETYGYNQSKFDGFFYEKDRIAECRIEIYHFGDMLYITED